MDSFLSPNYTSVGHLAPSLLLRRREWLVTGSAGLGALGDPEGEEGGEERGRGEERILSVMHLPQTHITRGGGCAGSCPKTSSRAPSGAGLAHPALEASGPAELLPVPQILAGLARGADPGQVGAEFQVGS